MPFRESTPALDLGARVRKEDGDAVSEGSAKWSGKQVRFQKTTLGTSRTVTPLSVSALPFLNYKKKSAPEKQTPQPQRDPHKK